MEKIYVINGEWTKVWANIVCKFEQNLIHQGRNLDIIYLEDYGVTIRGGGKKYFRLYGKNEDSILKAKNALENENGLEINELEVLTKNG